MMESLVARNLFVKRFLATKLFGLFGCVEEASDPYFSALLSLYTKVVNPTAMLWMTRYRWELWFTR